MFFIKKQQSDGSEEVAEELRKHRASNTLLKVCGVFLNHCVKETVIGLSKQTHSKIQVLSEACAECCVLVSKNHTKYKQDFEYYSRYPGNICFV